MKKIDQLAPKAAKSSYMIFFTQYRNQLKVKQPELSVTEMAKEGGRKWKEMSSSQRSKFQKKAADDKIRYDREKQAYQSGSGVQTSIEMDDCPPTPWTSLLDDDQVRKPPWTSLPGEVWLSIFRLLPTAALVSMSRTCRVLRSLGQDPGLWTRVSLDWQSIKNKAGSCEELVSRCQKLRRLTITNRTFEQVNSPVILSMVRKAARDSLTR